MILGIDHIVILVDDLAAASGIMRRGIHGGAGGEHAGGRTHMRWWLLLTGATRN